MANICLICSSPGDYDIFAPIPAYLHASTNEFLLWPKDISKMLEETTGLIVTADDILLPRKICALCISYLKHAATFRQQAIDNILNLKAAQILNNPDKHIVKNNSNSIIIKENQLNFSQARSSDLKNILVSRPKTNKCDDYVKRNFEKSSNNLSKSNSSNDVCRNLIDNSKNLQEDVYQEFCSNDVSKLSNKTKNSNIHLNTYLNLLFDKDTNKTVNNRRRHYNYQMSFQKTNNELNDEINPNDLELDDILSASSDENDFVDHKKTNFFNYKEKNFEEDDILNDILKDANIIINIPEIHKERKCSACSKRFMFEDSYEEHKSICMEYQLLCLIEEVNRLLIIRRKKSISPHEFVRRVIFSLKKIADWLRSHGENIDIPSQSDVRKSAKKLNKKKENENTSDMVQNYNLLNSNLDEKLKLDSMVKVYNENKKNNSFKEIINSKIETKTKTDTPESESSQSIPENTFQTIQQNAEKTAADAVSKNNFTSSSFSGQSNNNSNKNYRNDSFNSVLLTPVGRLTSPTSYKASPSPKLINFSARCSVCNLVFETIGALENHNAKFHNFQLIEKEEHKKIIALFEDE